MPTSSAAGTRRSSAKPLKQAASKNGQYFTRSAAKALETLEILKRMEAPAPLKELARRLKLAKTSAFRLLNTLESAGYIERKGEGVYALAPEVKPLLPTRFLTQLLRVAAPQMSELVRVVRETASLAALFDNHVEVVAVVESPQVIRMGNVVGRILPPNASSMGKVIMAYQGEARREKLLRSYGIYSFTPSTITDESALKHEFDRIRNEGYATDDEECVQGGCCFAVPIPSQDGPVLAAMSVSIPKMRLPDTDKLQALITTMKHAAGTIARELSAAK